MDYKLSAGEDTFSTYHGDLLDGADDLTGQVNSLRRDVGVQASEEDCHLGHQVNLPQIVGLVAQVVLE